MVISKTFTVISYPTGTTSLEFTVSGPGDQLVQLINNDFGEVAIMGGIERGNNSYISFVPKNMPDAEKIATLGYEELVVI